MNTLEDKGYTGIDIFWFLFANGNPDVIFLPRPPDLLHIWGSPGMERSIEEQEKLFKEHKEKELQKYDKQWEEAAIAVDFLRHK